MAQRTVEIDRDRMLGGRSQCTSQQFGHDFGGCQHNRRQQGAGVEPPWMGSRRVMLVFGKIMSTKLTGTYLVVALHCIMTVLKTQDDREL